MNFSIGDRKIHDGIYHRNIQIRKSGILIETTTVRIIKYKIQIINVKIS